MKFRVKDIRDNDTKLKKGAIASKPDHIQQQLINFAKSTYKDGVDLHLTPYPSAEKAARKVVLDFLAKNANLKHMYGILFKTLKMYFEFEEIKLPTFRDAFKHHLDALRN